MQKISLKKVAGLFIVGLFISALFSFRGDNESLPYSIPAVLVVPTTADLFKTLNLEDAGLAEDAFNYAIKGFNSLKATGRLTNDSIISIIDFTQASDRKRLYVIDLNQGKVLFNTYVSHGRNSGLSKASNFSNKRDSYKSSLGFYVTENTYKGKHGYSLRLVGEERGFNDNAKERGIVMHAADYVNEAFVKARGYIGRSEGCPAIPQKLHKAVISKIKDGSCLFIYSADPYYLKHSQLLKTA